MKLQSVQLDEQLLPEEVVQQEMAKIAVMKGVILRTIEQPVSNFTIQTLRNDLRGFHEGLPDWMKLSHLTSSSGMSSSLRLIIFYVHLFYLSALMLLHRLVLRNIENVANSITAPASTEEMRNAAVEGYLAAKSAARILHLLLTNGSVVKFCWLSMYVKFPSTQIDRAID